MERGVTGGAAGMPVKKKGIHHCSDYYFLWGATNAVWACTAYHAKCYQSVWAQGVSGSAHSK